MRRAYGPLRDIVESHAGSMVYQRQGYRHGAWVISINGKTRIIEATGCRSFPELDKLFVPNVASPQTWDDYRDDLVADAEHQLLSMLDLSGDRPERLPKDEVEGLAQLVQRTQWKFAWTYARTYPHEYTTKALCSPKDHARLIDCIERYGVIERFGNSRRKYFHFQKRKY